MALQNETKLNNGVTMPLQGYGVFRITDEAVCKEGVKAALAAGVRLIDTAACYGNERAVGTAIRESDVPRKDIFISSKVWIQDAGYEKTKASFAKTLENLGTDYLDLYLIHMPYGDYHGAWRAMEELYKAGKIRAIGVCNFLPDRLLDLILTHDVVPAVNQMETHPFCQQKKLREVMESYGIRLMAWAPFAEGQCGIFTDPTLADIGAHYKKHRRRSSSAGSCRKTSSPSRNPSMKNASGRTLRSATLPSRRTTSRKSTTWIATSR